MVPIAPRYRPRILDLVRALDDRTVPIAETNRRVGRVALQIGLYKPSYVHIKRLVKAERRRQDEIREIVGEVAGNIARGFVVDTYEVAERIRDAQR